MDILKRLLAALGSWADEMDSLPSAREYEHVHVRPRLTSHSQPRLAPMRSEQENLDDRISRLDVCVLTLVIIFRLTGLEMQPIVLLSHPEKMSPFPRRHPTLHLSEIWLLTCQT